MDEKSLAIAYNIKRRTKKGDLVGQQASEEVSPRKERLLAMLAEGGAVKEEAAESYESLDEMFPESEMVEELPEEINSDQKRKDRLQSILSENEVKFSRKTP